MRLPANCVSDVSFQKPLAMSPSGWLGHGPFAFWLMAQHRPRQFVELGTHHGYSYFCFCQQVKSMGLGVRCSAVDTWRGDDHAGFYDDGVFTALKAYNDSHYADFSDLKRSSFDDALALFEDKSIDLLHIDGRHFYEDVKHDFESWKRKLSSRAIVLFHDTQVREREFGVWKLWDELVVAYPHFEFTHSHGLGVLGVGKHPSVRNFPLFQASQSDEMRNFVRRTYESLGSRL